jgi:hypothetical protein
MMNGNTYVDWMLNASWIQIACQVDLSLPVNQVDDKYIPTADILFLFKAITSCYVLRIATSYSVVTIVMRSEVPVYRHSSLKSLLS